MEGQRISAKRKKIGLIGVYVALAIFQLSLSLHPQNFVLLIVFILATYFPLYRYLIRKTTFNFKTNIAKKLIEFVQPEMEYNPEKGVFQKTIDASDLFEANRKFSINKDFMDGYIDGTHLRCAEIKVDAFNCIFLYFPFHIEFDEEAVVLPTIDPINIVTNLAGKAQSLLAGNSIAYFNNTQNFFRRVRDNPLENDINKSIDLSLMRGLYTLEGDATFEGKSIFTPALLQKMMDYTKLAGAPVAYSFTRGNLIIAIPSKEDFLEPSIDKPLTEETFVQWGKCLSIIFGSVGHFKGE